MSDDLDRPDPLARVVHLTLLGGVIASAALLLLGLVMARGNEESVAEPVNHLAKLIKRALSGDGVAVVDTGLIVLMLTPVCRVIVLGVGWSVRRNWSMALVALTVALLLSASVFWGVG